MIELFRRLFKHPILSVEILTATFFIAVFNLASPIFVISVLNRYVTCGFDGTLITLTAGMLIAVALQYGFRVARTRMLGPISAGPDMQLEQKVLGVLANARAGPLERLPNARIQETMGGLQTIQSAYDVSNIIAILDAPFALLYVTATYFLSPVLALIALVGILCALAMGGFSLLHTRKVTENLQDAAMAHKGLISSAVHSSDTVRAFDGKNFLFKIWNDQIQWITTLRLKLANRKEQAQSLILTSSLLMTVALYTTGAILVVKGNLTVGALIGANILASRSYQSVVRFVQTSYLLYKARRALRKLKEFTKLPVEPESGTAIKQYKGGIQFKDLGFAYPNSTAPLFESLSLDLKAGSILVVTGKNGTGKTTLAKLIMGLLLPSRGDILIDGINLRQIAPNWLRRQMIYFPQEPTFINTTIQDNITLINPDLPGTELNRIIRAADLRDSLDRTQDGLETRLTEGGRHLSLGIRRRIALARALVTNGMLAVFDEPTEGLDADGCQAVYSVLNDLSKTGRTIITFSGDPRISKGAHYILDLNEKPVPKISKRIQGEGNSGQNLK